MRSWIARDRLVGVGGDDGEGLDRLAARPSASSAPTGRRSAKSGGRGTVIANGCLRPGLALPLEEAGGRDDAAALLHRLAEGGLLLDRSRRAR